MTSTGLLRCAFWPWEQEVHPQVPAYNSHRIFKTKTKEVDGSSSMLCARAASTPGLEPPRTLQEYACVL